MDKLQEQQHDNSGQTVLRERGKNRLDLGYCLLLTVVSMTAVHQTIKRGGNTPGLSNDINLIDVVTNGFSLLESLFGVLLNPKK